MKTVLLTGASGFIGTEVLRRLAIRGDARVIALDSNIRHRLTSDLVQYIDGDLGDPICRAAAIGEKPDAVVHLAAVPGGAAESDPGLSQRVNIEATLNLLREFAALGGRPRFVFSSTIAVFGESLPTEGVNDSTDLQPHMIYGAHKAMIETMISTLSRRGAIDGVSLRLPGIVARPRGPSGLKSAFMSNLFHELCEAKAFTSPVSPAATLWLMSVEQCAANLIHALHCDSSDLPDSRALTLPALYVTMADLVAAVAAQTRVRLDRVTYRVDSALEQAFGRQPPLATPAAESAGFAHDGNLDTLVARALTVLARPQIATSEMTGSSAL